MKFKKDGNVFEDIWAALDSFRCPGPCNPDCPLCVPAYAYGKASKHPICGAYVVGNQAEAARLMGYEVVEDNATEKGLYRKYIVKKADTGEEVTDCFILRPTKDHAAVAALKEYARVTDNKTLADDILQWVDPKDANMDNQSNTSQVNQPEPVNCGSRKPRICEVLGVEVGERFSLYSSSGFTLSIEADGSLYRWNGSSKTKEDKVIANALIDCINDRDALICKKPRFTEEEAADARAIMRLFGDRFDSIERTDFGLGLCHSGQPLNLNIWLDTNFPSILPGQ